MTKALDGVRILDFTQVQSRATCTQLLAWFDADVIKVERADTGYSDATRRLLMPRVDNVYVTMLNQALDNFEYHESRGQGRSGQADKDCDA